MLAADGRFPVGTAGEEVGMACRELEEFPSERDVELLDQRSFVVGILGSELEGRLVVAAEGELGQLLEVQWLVQRRSSRHRLRPSP